MYNETKCSYSEILRQNIITVEYDKSKPLSYNQILQHEYEYTLQNYLYKPFDEYVEKSVKEELYVILRKVINDNINKYIEINVKSQIQGIIDITYEDKNTNKEVFFEDLYKYTPKNIKLIRDGLKPINNAM